jgi:GTP-binding protein
VPILFISVKEKTRMGLDVFENRKRRIATSVLNEILLKAIEAYNPPVVRGNAIKIKYVTQIPTVVPSFAFFCNYPDEVKTPYKNYLENKLRENFDFKGVPVRIFFRKK